VTDFPVLSVVVPCLNRAQFIRPTLESILAQDYPNVECIVVDGGSTDGTMDIVRSYTGRLRWLSEPDLGPADAINKGWQRSRGEYLAWLNADDLWLPNAVTTVVRSFQEGADLDVVYGACGAVDAKGRLHWVAPPAAWSLEDAVLYCDTVINQPAGFVRRSIVEKIGWLHADWCHDHDLWIRIALAGGRFGTTSEHLANCRIWAGDAHNDPNLMLPALLRLVGRTFARPDLPDHLRGRLRQTQSFAYLRCLDYLVVTRPSHWLLALNLIRRAFLTDPGSAGIIFRQVLVRIPLAARRLADKALAFRKPKSG